MSNLDKLLQIASMFGAEAAWLLRGADSSRLRYSLDEIGGLELELIDDFGPVLFVARLPDDGSDETSLIEVKPAPGGDREMQAMALLAASLDALTRIGPNTTVRAIIWAFARYGINWPSLGRDTWLVRDRRPPKPPPSPPAPEPPPSAIVPAEQPEASDAPTIGQQLRDRRLALGLSQRALGERAGLSQGRVSYVEQCYTMDAELVARLDEALTAIEKERGQ